MRPREHYIQQLEGLHTELRALGQMVIVSITKAIAALRQQDVATAKQVIADDERIDQAQYRLEEHVLVVMATQQPMARDLRQLVAAIEIASELERIGDYAKGIAKITVRNSNQPLVNPLLEIPQMSEQAINMLGSALDAYVNVDADAARGLSNADDTVDELVTRMRAELIELIQNDPSTTARAVDLLFVTHNLERIADRTTNIAERVIFIASGDVVDLNP
ncbi:MAG TPA: phosphate signaling complex protein PhoU [Kouleothrix sp.]|uniref:phosphate signaling complex protein PhoU n=1 Tax=Kouleothrix sp. TaxID=2779161 RepID=UPI002B5F9564|nr:phosphate signaling complex protein PhoU [Kouleothrix sp.]HRC75384.1 phosphate signaling complex protein PhoU [Kouleothrix sp.]